LTPTTKTVGVMLYQFVTSIRRTPTKRLSIVEEERRSPGTSTSDLARQCRDGLSELVISWRS
jgi:hypothetical protein